jgi:hypothetical protein
LIERLIKLVEATLGLLEHYNPSVTNQMREELNEIKATGLESNMDGKISGSSSEETGSDIQSPQDNNIQDL